MESLEPEIEVVCEQLNVGAGKWSGGPWKSECPSPLSRLPSLSVIMLHGLELKAKRPDPSRTLLCDVLCSDCLLLR